MSNSHGQSALCFAFSRASKDAIEKLLKPGCVLQACEWHESVWQCFVVFNKISQSGFSVDVMKLMIKAGADVNKVDEEGRSPLCLALFNGAGVDDINLLLSEGGSFNDCQKHASPLLCVTDGCSRALLTAEVIELLINKGASWDEVNRAGLTPLQLALRYCRYETAAIRILLNLPGVDIANIRHECFGNLLQVAVNNSKCKLSIAKFLLDKCSRPDEADGYGTSLLFDAILSDNRDLRIIALLVKNGSLINVKDCNGHTHLSLAVNQRRPCYVLKLLFTAGADINASTNLNAVQLLERALIQCNSYYEQERLDRCKVLLKWLLIDNPNFNFRSLIQGPYSRELSRFAEECAHDLQKIESESVGNGLTFIEFIKGYFPQSADSDRNPKLNSFDFDQLLQVISINPCPTFYDVVSAKVGKLLIPKLQESSVYTVKRCLDCPCMEPTIVCDYDSLCEIVKYLSEEDLLCLILAFYNTSDYKMPESSTCLEFCKGIAEKEGVSWCIV